MTRGRAAHGLRAARGVVPALCVLLAGCAAPMDIAQMQLEMTERLDTAAKAPMTADVALGDGFRPALRAAVLADQTYRAALAEEAAALAQIGVAASVRQPQLASRLEIGTTAGEGAVGSGAAAGLVLSQTVYDGGALVATVNRATALALAARAGRVAASNDSALSAASSWIMLRHYRARAAQTQGQAAEMELLVSDIARMADNGLLDRADLAHAQRQIVDLRLEEERLLEAVATAERSFGRAFPAQRGSLPAPEALLSETAARALAQGWATAPMVQQQAATLLASEAALAEVEAQARPRARLELGARSPDSRDDVPALSLGLVLDYTVYDAGRAERQVAAATARVTADQAKLVEAQNGLQEGLQSALARLATIERALILGAEKLRLSRAEAETARAQLLTGAADLRRLIEIEITIYRAQDQQMVLQAEREILLLTIAARTGALAGLVGLGDALPGVPAISARE